MSTYCIPSVEYGGTRNKEKLGMRKTCIFNLAPLQSGCVSQGKSL